MAAIPLGLTGAVLGHILLGLHFNPMSMLGLFTSPASSSTTRSFWSAPTSAGAEGTPAEQAIEDAVCMRLRPVI